MPKPKNFRQILLDFEAAHAQAIEDTVLAAQYQIVVVYKLEEVLDKMTGKPMNTTQENALKFTGRCARDISNGANNLLKWKGKFDPARIEKNVNVALRGWLEKLIQSNPPYPKEVEELKVILAELLENANGI
jgi:hypothetical protein